MSDHNFGEELGRLAPDLALGATSEQIMRRGRRIRTIRQSSVVGAAAVAVAGIASIAALAAGHHATQTVQSGSGNGLSVAGAPAVSPAPAASTSSAPPASALSSQVASALSSPTYVSKSSQPAAVSSGLASASPTASCLPAAQSTDGAPSATPDGDAPPWGDLVNAGTDVGTSTRLVLYGVHIDDSAIPCTHFGMMVGTLDASGTATGQYEANEVSGSDLEPGFHAVSLVGKEFAGTYFIGYYVGPAASISVIVNGVPTTAHVAAWSVNPDVKFWWLGGSANGNPTLGALTAKDAGGNALPVGAHAQLGVG